jgi:hypothetical protein
MIMITRRIRGVTKRKMLEQIVSGVAKTGVTETGIDLYEDPWEICEVGHGYGLKIQVE